MDFQIIYMDVTLILTIYIRRPIIFNKLKYATQIWNESTLVKLNTLFRMALEFFFWSDQGKGAKFYFQFWKSAFLRFWLITFEPNELHEKTNHFFVDLSEMQIPSKFGANRRSFRESKLEKINFSAILNL